jgi:hypothetical protein
MVLAASLCTGSAVHAQEASPCLIDTRTGPEIRQVLAQFGLNFDGYDSLCSALDSAGMGVALDGVQGQVGDRSYGLIMLKVFDRSNNIESLAQVSVTSLDMELTSEGSAMALIRAINGGMQFLSTNSANYIASTHAETARLQTLLSEQ